MSTGKIHIEKNSVQETLLVPLYGRKMCSEKFPALYTDTSAKLLCESLDYDFSELEKKKDTFLYEFGALEAAMRQLDIMWEVRDYLKEHPKAAVVNLGCGLDQTGLACDNGQIRIVNIDFPDIIRVREQLIPVIEGREKNIASDLKDYSWMDEIDGSNGVIFFAAGVFHYFRREEVKDMVLTLSENFKGGRLIFDTVGKTGLKLMMSKTLKNMGIKDVSGFFSLDDPGELQWSERLKVSSKGYMLGYYDMKSDGIKASHRLLSRIGDGWMKMAVNRIEFL